MKKILLLFMIVFLVSTFNVFGQEISLWDGEIPEANLTFTFSGGDGNSEETPYLIGSAADLAQLAANVKGGNLYENVCFKLTTDINLNLEEWYPIGSANSFKGIFDGDNKTIQKLKITQQTTNAGANGAGLFGTVSGAAVLKNVHISNANLKANQTNAAVLVGYLSGMTAQVKQCSVRDSEVAAGGGLAQRTAIFIANANGATIEDCYVANSKLTENGQHNQGGFIGTSGNIKLRNCFMANCNVGYNAGGNGKGIFIGNITTSEITNCYIDYTGENPLFNKGLDLVNVIIKNGNTVITASDLIKAPSAFANGKIAWELNTNSGTITNTNTWSNDESCPIFTDEANPAIVKVGAIDNVTPLYAKGLAAFSAPESFSYITNAKEITTGEITGITKPANSNSLIYVGEGVTVNGWSTNVVAGTTCASLALTDGKSFVCPTAFTATKATYTRDCYTDGGWESIALPFAVTAIKADGNDVSADYTIEGYAQNNGATIKFTPLETITGWEAGKAYIMKYNGEAGSSQTCVFESDNAAINADATDAPFMGTFTGIAAGEATDNYILVADGTQFKKASASASIPAFRAYLKKATDPVNAPASYIVNNQKLIIK